MNDVIRVLLLLAAFLPLSVMTVFALIWTVVFLPILAMFVVATFTTGAMIGYFFRPYIEKK